MFGAYHAPLVEDVGDKVDKTPVALLVNWQWQVNSLLPDSAVASCNHIESCLLLSSEPLLSVYSLPNLHKRTRRSLKGH